MSTIHLHQTTTSTPEQFLAALIDFGPGRSKLFGNSADKYLTYGIGFRLHSNRAFISRLDLAFSREGFIPLLRFEHVF